MCDKRVTEKSSLVWEGQQVRRPFFFLETRVIYSPFFNPFP